MDKELELHVGTAVLTVKVFLHAHFAGKQLSGWATLREELPVKQKDVLEDKPIARPKY